MAFNDEPTLPTTPFPYGDIELPDHLADPDPGTDIGYGSTGVNTNNNLDIDDDKATLGRVLFYDEKLSTLEDISCGGCHLQEKSFADETSFSEGVNLPTKRNSMNLNDLLWSNKDHFLWDMKETDLHNMIRLPLNDENEIGANLDDIVVKLAETNYYPDLFRNAFGTSAIDEEKIIDALVHFISSMTTFDSKFDEGAADDFSNFSEKELAGLEIFSESCTSCHSQGSHDPHGFFPGGFNIEGQSPLNFFPEIFNNGLPIDVDDRGAGENDTFFMDLFKIPVLRNIELTGPYMHDGRFNSLEEVIDHYSDNVQTNNWTEFGFIPEGGFHFTDSEKDNLLAFLMTLTGKKLTTHEMWANPFGGSTSIAPDPVENLVVKPNPMSDFSIIEFENKGNTLTQISILNMAGQLMKSDKTLSNSYTINKGDFSTGTYLIEITQADKKSIQKLIVK